MQKHLYVSRCKIAHLCGSLIVKYKPKVVKMKVEAKSAAIELMSVAAVYTVCKQFQLSRVHEAALFVIVTAARAPIDKTTKEITSAEISYGLANAAKTFVTVYLLRGDHRLITQLSSVVGNPQDLGLAGLTLGWGATCVWDISTAKDPNGNKNELAKWIVSWFDKKNEKKSSGANSLGSDVKAGFKEMKKAVKKAVKKK